MKILVVFKESNYEIYSRRAQLERSPHAMAELKGGHDQHERTIAAVKTALAGCDATWVRRDRVRRFEEQRFDLALTVGGDGTLLTLAPHLHHVPVLAVNSAPKVSVGYFAAANAKNIRAWIARIEKRAVQPAPIQRLLVTCDGQPFGPPVLNDVLFSHPQPAGTSRLLLRAPPYRKSEVQKNSGVWVSTPAGSNGAVGSAGGKRMALTGRVLQYVVREPYLEKKRYEQLGGEIHAGQELLIESRMPQAQLSFDGWATVFTVPFGARLVFSHHPHPLMLFAPKR